MKNLCQTNYEDLSPLARWKRTALQLPGDIGGPRKEDIKKSLTRRAKGKVLEAMCGFNSYFGNSKNTSEVVVLDFCQEMLERYPYPERKRGR